MTTKRQSLYFKFPETSREENAKVEWVPVFSFSLPKEK